VAWPTNLGWMMGPWLVYAALLNGGTIALYQVDARACKRPGPARDRGATMAGGLVVEGRASMYRDCNSAPMRLALQPGGLRSSPPCGSSGSSPSPQPSQGAPLGRDFVEFVESAGVEVLGLVPSIVKAWRAVGCLANAGWRRLRCFSSTGEASAPEDYHWLSSRVLGYRPVIE
jgi:hypothetical protein